jgi:hypothetical protein
MKKDVGDVYKTIFLILNILFIFYEDDLIPHIH